MSPEVVALQEALFESGLLTDVGDAPGSQEATDLIALLREKGYDVKPLMVPEAPE